MVRSSLTLEAAKTLVHVFVSSCLDYANSLLYGISDGLLAKLQTVQNAEARVVTGTRKFDHITPVLHQLHWLPVRQRITFKLAMITFKCLHGLAPSYLADVCILSVGGSCSRLTAGHSLCHAATHQDYDRLARLCCVAPGHMEQPPHRTVDFATVFSDVCEKTQKSFIRLLAPLKTCLTGAI